MSWFRNKGGGRNDSGGGITHESSPRLSPTDTDPDTCLEVFKIHWKQALTIIQSPREDVNVESARTNFQSDEIETVIHNVEQMVNLLISETSSNGMPGTILLYLLEHEVLDKFSAWCADVSDFGERLKIEQLKMYEMLIGQAKQLLLIHRPVIQPLLRLLSQCAESLEHYRSKELERRVVLVLHQLCVCLSQQTLILESFFLSDADHGPAKFLIFSLLIPYVHREGNVGQQARDALLLIMALSARHNNIGTYVAQNSHFCPVLATGLSGLYSSLPRKLDIPSDDWHQLTTDDIALMPDLQMFLNSLEFCNAVAQVAHPLVREQLISYIYNGFLFPVLGPALHQNSRDEIIATTAYLELFLRRITEPSLLRAFLKFVVVGKFDDLSILDSLIARINTNSRLCVSSLSLFKTLVELNCEDVMFQLVFRYLIPCTHVMVSQRRAVKELDLYSKSAEKFLSLQPACCVLDEGSLSQSPATGKTNWPAFNQSSDGVFDSPVTPVNHSFQSASPASDRSDSAHSPNKSGLGLTRLFRSNSSLGRSMSSGRSKAIDSRNSASSSGSTSSTQELMETSYMDYLHEAQLRIVACARACQNWSAPYDGELPPPDSDLSETAATKPCSVTSEASTVSVVPPQEKLSPPVSTNGHQGSEPSSEIIGAPPSQNTQQAATTTTAALTVSSTSCASTPLSGVDLSKCLDLESFMNYLNTVELTSPSTPQDVEGYLNELDRLASQIPSHPAGGEHRPVIDGAASQGRDKLTLPIAVDQVNRSSFVNMSISDLDFSRGGRGESAVTPVRSPDSSKARWSVASSDRSSVSSQDGTQRHSSVDSCASLSKVTPRPAGAKYPSAAPDIGPFLSALLSKLEGMMTNSLYVNLLLTGLISRLSCYPKPLLRSFLLNHNLVFQPSVKSLMQVLTSVRQKVDSFALSQPNFDMLLQQARKFLVLREQMYLSEVNGSGQLTSPEKGSAQMTSKPARSQSEFVRGDKRRTSISDLLFKKSPAKDQRERGQSTPPSGTPVLERITSGTGYRFVNAKQSQANTIPENPLETMKTKNAVFCALILEEFVKELAALAQEHAVLSLDEGYASS